MTPEEQLQRAQLMIQSYQQRLANASHEAVQMEAELAVTRQQLAAATEKPVQQATPAAETEPAPSEE